MRAAKRFEDLLVWQLGDQIRVLTFQLTERDCFARDLKLHSQTEDAVNSVCRNIAEGFGCKHKEFARFLEISRRSVNEVRDSFRTAQLKQYVTAHEYEPIWRLTQRLYPALGRLIRHLRTTPDPDWTNPKKTRPEHPERARTDRAKPNRSDPAQRTRTDPAQQARTDPAQPTRTDPAERTRTDPAQPNRTDPAQRTRTDPAQPTRTDPAQQTRTDAAQPTRTNPAQPTRTDPAQPTRTDPAQPPGA